VRVNSCRWDRSHRANASSIASASCLKLWLRAAAKIRPGRGQYRSPWPSTRSTLIEGQVRAKVHLRAVRCRLAWQPVSLGACAPTRQRH
jgi:hypothetical protein